MDDKKFFTDWANTLKFYSIESSQVHIELCKYKFTLFSEPFKRISIYIFIIIEYILFNCKN